MKGSHASTRWHRRHSQTNCHSRNSISHYSFWNFRSKTKSGSQVPLSVLVPKSKSKSWSSLFVLELLLPIPKAESFFHYSFWNFRSQNERRSCWSWTFVLEHEWKSQVDFSLPVLEPLLQVENPKAKFHYSISHPNRNLDPRQKKKNGDPTNEIRLRMNGRGCGCVLGGRECFTIGVVLNSLSNSKLILLQTVTHHVLFLSRPSEYALKMVSMWLLFSPAICIIILYIIYYYC